MAFEDAIASLGRDLGIDLVVEDGVAEFVAASADGGEQIEVTISVLDDGVSALLCADLGEMPAKGSDRLMLRMLEANHLFGATGGATPRPLPLSTPPCAPRPVWNATWFPEQKQARAGTGT